MSVAHWHVVVPDTDGADVACERDLVERAKCDREAFAMLYRRHYRMLTGYVYRRLGDVHATEDLVAEVFLSALRALPRYRYRGVPLRFWLLRIATHAVNRSARRNRRMCVEHAELERVPQTAHEGSSTPDDADRERARRALLSLSPKHQAVLALHHLEGLCVADVAAILGCRVGTVKSRLARARDALREKLT